MFSQRMRIRKTCNETRTFSTTLTRVDKKKKKKRCVESVEKMIAGAAFVGCTRWNTKKRLNILSEGCRETVACEKDAVSIVKLQKYSALNYAYYSR